MEHYFLNIFLPSQELSGDPGGQQATRLFSAGKVFIMRCPQRGQRSFWNDSLPHLLLARILSQQAKLDQNLIIYVVSLYS